MGLFLQVAIMPGCKEAEAREVIQAVASKYAISFDELESGDFDEDFLENDMLISELFPDECQYAESAHGVSILINDGCIGHDSLAKAVSKETGKVCLLLCIYDGDYWGYWLYENGTVIDEFNPMPDYFEAASEKKRQKVKGNAEIIARYFDVEAASIEKYLVHWSEDMMDKKAYEDDEFGYEDWQMVDFMRKLGYPYEFNEE